jgi:hypothetical protein
VLASAAADGRVANGGRPVLLMPGIVYGHGAGLIEQFFTGPARTRHAVRIIGDGSNHWSLVHVDDVAELYALALDAPAGSVYAGVPVSDFTVAQIAEAVSRAAGAPAASSQSPWSRHAKRWGLSPTRSPSTSRSAPPAPATNWAGTRRTGTSSVRSRRRRHDLSSARSLSASAPTWVTARRLFRHRAPGWTSSVAALSTGQSRPHGHGRPCGLAAPRRLGGLVPPPAAVRLAGSS